MKGKDYISGNHSKFLIKYHIILVCKYRKRLLSGRMVEDMKRIIRDISDRSDFDIEVMESDIDHIHLLVGAAPRLSPLQIVRRIKQMSTCAVWKTHGAELVRQFYRDGTFWTDGYFVSSIGNVSQAAVREYIENQG